MELKRATEERPMDPDLVRQQEEAEREAMRLAGRKPETPSPLIAPSMLRASAVSGAQSSKPILPGDAGPAPYYSRPRQAPSPIGYFGQFLSFALAGAMLGGGLGIAAANYMQLPVEAAKLAIYGPAGFFALTCALASFFTGSRA
jgi:hypothetical protein